MKAGSGLNCRNELRLQAQTVAIVHSTTVQQGSHSAGSRRRRTYSVRTDAQTLERWLLFLFRANAAASGHVLVVKDEQQQHVKQDTLHSTAPCLFCCCLIRWRQPHISKMWLPPAKMIFAVLTAQGREHLLDAKRSNQSTQKALSTYLPNNLTLSPSSTFRYSD